MKDGLISVVIPTYNRMNTLPRAVESVLRQTYQNFELIIVDDCSFDSTKEYIDSLGDERIRYHRNEVNQGAAGSRNTGVSLARGEYIAFQDSDDEWLPNKLEAVLECLNQEENQDADLIFHQMEEIDGDQSRVITNIPLADISTELYPYMLCFPVVGPPASLIKREAFTELGGFCAQCKSFEDYELSLRLAKNKKVVYLPQVLTRVYDSPDSVNKNFEAKIDTELYIIKTLFSDYQNYDLLQKKLELVYMQAVNYDCEAYFYEKIMDVYEELPDKDAEESLYKLILVSITQRGSASDKSEYFREAAGTLSHISDSLKRLKGNITRSPQILMQNLSSIKQALKDVICDTLDYSDLTDHPFVQKNKMNMLDQKLEKSGKNTASVKTVLDELIMETDSILMQINQTKYICGKCWHEVKMLPMSPCYSILRKRLGFAGDKITFLFENENADICPVCSGNTEERFLLTFLNDIQPENGEKLVISVTDNKDEEDLIAEKKVQKLKFSVKSYADSKEYACYTDISDLTGQKQREECALKADVLICHNLLEIEDAPEKLLTELKGCLKENGIMIVMLSALDADLCADGAADRTADEMSDGASDSTIDVISDRTEIEYKNNPAESFRRFGLENICRIYSEEELLKIFNDAGFHCTVIDNAWFGEELYERMAFPDCARLYMLESNI